MHRFLTRFVALVLIPCLLIEPLCAAGAIRALPLSLSETNSLSACFQQEALSAAILEIRLSLQERIAARIKRLAGASLARVDDTVADAALNDVIEAGEAVAVNLNQPTEHYLRTGAGERPRSAFIWLTELIQDLEPSAATQVQHWVSQEENAAALGRGIDLLRQTVMKSNQRDELLRHRYVIVFGDHPMFAGGRILAHAGNSTIYISLEALEFAAQADAPRDGLRYVLEHENHHHRGNPGRYTDANGHAYRNRVENQRTSQFYEQFEASLRRKYRKDVANLSWDQLIRRSHTLMYLQIASHLLCSSEVLPVSYGLVPFLEDSLEGAFEALRDLFPSTISPERFDQARFHIRIGEGMDLEKSLRPILQSESTDGLEHLPLTNDAAYVTVNLPPEAPRRPVFAADRQFTEAIRAEVMRHDNAYPILIGTSSTLEMNESLRELRGLYPATTTAGRTIAGIQEQLDHFVLKADRGPVTQADLVPVTSALEDAVPVLAQQAIDQAQQWILQDLRGLGIKVESGSESSSEVQFLRAVQEKAMTATSDREKLVLLERAMPTLLHVAEKHRADPETAAAPLHEIRHQVEAAKKIESLYRMLLTKRSLQQAAQVISPDETINEIFALRDASGRTYVATPQPFVYESLDGEPPSTINLLNVPAEFQVGLRLLVYDAYRLARQPDDYHEIADPEVLADALPQTVADPERLRADIAEDLAIKRRETLTELYHDDALGSQVFEALGVKEGQRAIIFGATPLANALALSGMKTLFINPSSEITEEIYHQYMSDMSGIFQLGGLLIGFEADLDDFRAAYFFAEHSADLVVAIQAPLAPESLAAIPPASDILTLYVGPQPEGWAAYEEALHVRGGWIIEESAEAALPETPKESLAPKLHNQMSKLLAAMGLSINTTLIAGLSDEEVAPVGASPTEPRVGRIYRLRRDPTAVHRSPPMPPARSEKLDPKKEIPIDWASWLDEDAPIMRGRLADWLSALHILWRPSRWATTLGLWIAKFIALFDPGWAVELAGIPGHLTLSVGRTPSGGEGDASHLAAKLEEALLMQAERLYHELPADLTEAFGIMTHLNQQMAGYFTDIDLTHPAEKALKVMKEIYAADFYDDIERLEMLGLISKSDDRAPREARTSA